jgi:ATP-dependent Clp protease protease subunit
MKATYYPTVIEKENLTEKAYDVISRLMKDRVIFLNGVVDDDSAGSIIAQLLFLEAEDPEKDIYMYINSPGGVITSGMAIYDTMNFISCDVKTICIGQAASMGAFLLSAGAPGKRFSLPHSRIMIHQPLGGAEGQASDIEIQAKEILRMKKELNEIMSKNSNGKTSYKKMCVLTDRDNFLSAKEALELGLIDEIITKR